MLRRPHQKEGPPVFSHEFIIQNHADIISCVCMVIFMGLIPQATNPLASSIIFMQYNKTVEPNNSQSEVRTSRIDLSPVPVTLYQHGWRDLFNIAFYALVWIIIQALLQEYIWERTVKRLRMSKVKTAKYFDSGSLIVFYFLSVVWGINHIAKEGYVLQWQQLWEGYPHDEMSLSLKFYMLCQMSFWLHCYPELYFMKTKKEKVYAKVVLYTSSLLLIGGAYFVKLQRFAVILLVLHYSVELLFHASRLLHYHGRDSLALPGFKIWQVLFVIVRILTVIISVLTLWFGLGKVHQELLSQPPAAAAATPIPVAQTIDEGEGEGQGAGLQVEPEGLPAIAPEEITKPLYRLVGLAFILLLQLWVGWTFLSHQMERSSTDGKPSSSSSSSSSSGEPGTLSAAPSSKKSGRRNDKANKSPKAKSS